MYILMKQYALLPDQEKLGVGVGGVQKNNMSICFWYNRSNVILWLASLRMTFNQQSYAEAHLCFSP